MIITCPNCATRYKINPASLGESGRMVRCSSCTHRWFVAPEPEPEPAAEPDPPPIESLASRPLPEEAAAPAVARSTGAIVLWLIVLFIVLVIAGLLVGRNEIVAAFPETAPYYQKLGLPITEELGLEFRHLDSERVQQDGVPLLVVEGEIHNLAGFARAVPPVRVSLLDGDREVVEERLFEVAQGQLEDGGMARFEARFEAPPEAARHFRVSFAVED